jgi:Methylamine utilisation protein MauE
LSLVAHKFWRPSWRRLSWSLGQPLPHTILVLCAGLSQVVILLAGIGKTIDASAFSRELSQWVTIPRWLVGPLTICVPATEIWLSSQWILDIRRQAISLLTIAILGAFTTLYAIEVFINSKPPHCSCMGLWTEYLNIQLDGRATLLRNLFMIASVSGYQVSHIQRIRSLAVQG